MSRKSRIAHAAIVNIKAHRRYGESKRECVLKSMENYSQTGVLERVEGMFSYQTEATYQKQAKHFVSWLVEKHPQVRVLEQAKQHVAEYLQEQIDKGLSASTIHTRAYAVASALMCKVEEFGVTLPIRHSGDFTRNRNVTPDTVFKEDTQYIHRFAAATGARRCELGRLKTDSLSYDSEGRLCVHFFGKGGKERDARVLESEREFVISVVEQAGQRNALRGNGCKRVFPDHIIPSREALHQHRHEYAHSLYDEVIRSNEHQIADRGLYRCRDERYGEVFNRTALAIVSYNLGHGQPDELPHEVRRVGVVVTNYLW